MPSTFIVSVDLERLRGHRSEAEHREMSSDDVRRWLVAGGFYPRVDGLFLCEEPVMRLLDPSEIIAARAVGGALS